MTTSCSFKGLNHALSRDKPLLTVPVSCSASAFMLHAQSGAMGVAWWTVLENPGAMGPSGRNATLVAVWAVVLLPLGVPWECQPFS